MAEFGFALKRGTEMDRETPGDGGESRSHVSSEAWEAPNTPPIDRHEQRRGVRTRKVVAVAAGLAILVLAGLTVSLWSQRSKARSEISRQADSIASLTGQFQDLKAKNSNLSSTQDALQSQLRDLRAKVSRTVGDLDSPHFVLWNSCGARGPAAGCALTPGREYVGGVPDTFTYFVSFRSTVPVTVWILSTSNFVCWETHNCAWHAIGWQDRTRLVGGAFHDAEGCAGYIAVFFSNETGTLYPNVSVTHNPASETTGACR